MELNMEDFIVKTIIGTYIIEDYGDNDYDVATNLSDSNIFYHIPKGLSEKEVQQYFEELKEIEK
jgi:hypothetical protein